MHNVLYRDLPVEPPVRVTGMWLFG